MKAFWKYELKRSLRLLLILLAVCIVPLVINCAQSELFWMGEVNGKNRLSVYDVLVPSAAFMIGALALCLPMYLYAFKSAKRSVDTWYALPIKRWKIYFIKTMVGFFLMIVPFTAAYWLGVGTLAIRENYYQMSAFIPTYFSLLFYGICLFGISAFFVTRANVIADGLVFLFGCAFLGMLLLETAFALFDLVLINPTTVVIPSAGRTYIRTTFETFDLTLFGGISRSTDVFSGLVCGEERTLEWWWFVIAAVYGALGYFGLFATAKTGRAEDAEQISTTWFGYKTLLPIYTTLAAFSFASTGGILIAVVGASIASLAGYIAYRRKIKIEKWDWICLVASVAIGIILSLFL